jgi:prepilin-type N-terminal cleavage/methylation domain-containing protein
MTERGFTLIETLVVLVILGLVVGLVVARGPSRSPGFLLRSEAQVLSARLAEARGSAIALDHDVDVGLSRNPPGLAIAGRPPVKVPPTVTLAMLTADGAVDPLARHIVFHPDGSADGGGLLLANSAGRIAVRVGWLTGRITVAARPSDAS